MFENGNQIPKAFDRKSNQQTPIIIIDDKGIIQPNQQQK